MKKIILVGARVSTAYFTGQAVAFEMLVEAFQSRPNVKIVNIDPPKKHGHSGNVRRSMEYFGIFFEFFFKAFGLPGIVYLTVAQSKKGFLRDMVFIWCSALFRHDIVCHIHGGNYDSFYESQSPLMKAIIRHTWLRVKTIIVLSENLRNMMAFEPRLMERVVVVPNGLPVDDFGTAKSLPGSDAPVKILYLSNLVETKGYLDVLEAVKILRDMKVNVEANFCGAFMLNPIDDKRVKDLESAKKLFFDFISEHKLQQNVFYHVNVGGVAKANVLETSHFFVLPTNYKYEGSPVSIIEALAHGNVVIATNYRGIPELVSDNETGVFVPYGSPEAIAKTIKQFIDRPDEFKRLSINSIAVAKNKFSRTAHLQKMVPIIEGNYSPFAAPMGN